MMKQAVILAGGKGTRLRECIGELPKPMVDICGKPLLDWQVNLLKRHGYTHILLLVNYGMQHIVEYCLSQNNWGINITCIDDGTPRGTAGATLSAIEHLHEDFLIVYGDTMLDVDLERFFLFYKSNNEVDCALYLHPNDHPYDSDLVEIDQNNQVIAIHPYPHQQDIFHANLVNAALYYFHRDSLNEYVGMTGIIDFGKDLFPKMLTNGQLLLGYHGSEYIKDCGTPERLRKVRDDILAGRVEQASLRVPQKAVFLDRDGVLNKEIGYISKHEQFELLEGAAEAIKDMNNAGYRAVVITNQPVLARGDCTFSDLSQIHNKMESQLGKNGAYLDRIYFCPHHPDKGYECEVAELKISCDCRKPEISMIHSAAIDLNIDIKQSWLIGDTTTDILTAKNAGLRSILVETGFAGKDGRHLVTSDFTVPDIHSASHFIIHDYPRLLAMSKKLSATIQKGGIVFIGGLSRSGKSNFASCLKQALLLEEKGVVLLELDRWLRDQINRGSSVLERYHIEEINALIEKLDQRSDTLSLELPFYNRLERYRADVIEMIKVKTDDIVILEGTIALLLSSFVVNRPLHRYFIELDEEIRQERVCNEYLIRGLSPSEAIAIYNERQIDETPLLLSSFCKSTKKIKLNLGSL